MAKNNGNFPPDNPIRQLRDELYVKDYTTGSKAARAWLKQKIEELKGLSSTSITRNGGDRLRTITSPNQLSIGRMYFFAYDPKWKHDEKKLPYYDNFPLIFPVDLAYSKKDPSKCVGFYGINFHYLSPRNRFLLLDKLVKAAPRSTKGITDTTKLQLSYYGVLKGAASLEAFKPCFKMYLWTQIRSRFLLIKPTEWDIALYLPFEEFERATKHKVWKESNKIIRGQK